MKGQTTGRMKAYQWTFRNAAGIILAIILVMMQYIACAEPGVVDTRGGKLNMRKDPKDGMLWGKKSIQTARQYMCMRP